MVFAMEALYIMNMATYETFAAVYDAVMDDSLYDKWTDFSLRHLLKTKERKKLLELACGTGIQSVRFSKAGFDVTGLDLSADMLKIAEKRAASAKQKIDFMEGNMLDLSKAGKYDFVTCYSDSICYMQDEVEVGDVFKEVYNTLNEDGVFIFDVHSTYQTDEVFPGYSYHENAEDFAMLWDTYEDDAPHSIVHELTFFIKEADGSFSRHDEVHEERTYEVLPYDILLEQAGFDVTGLDLSGDMLKIAEKRATSARQKIEFIEGNMLDLSKAGQYDFVTCYSDSICYMQDEVEVGDVFKEVYNALNEDGVFIFDVHSTYQIDEVFPGYSYHENAEDFAMLWDTYEDEAPHSIVHELTFFVKESDGFFSRHDEVHEERTYEILTYDILLEQAGFKSFKLYADFEDKEPTETSTRWFFVAQK